VASGAGEGGAVDMAATRHRSLTREQVQTIARALADPRRYEILKQLGAGCDAVQCSVVRGWVGVGAATLSHHMKELEGARLVAAVRDGKYVTYTLRRDVLLAYLDHMAKL